MNTRICTNPNCRTIQPGAKCRSCRTATQEIPPIPLHAIGVDGTARLVHKGNEGYSIAITIPSGPHFTHIPVSDLLHSAQTQLPHLNPVSGLTIMDAIRNTARLVKTKNTSFWAGWVIYLLEILQDYTDPGPFQNVLRTLRQDLDTCFIEPDGTMPMHSATELHEVERRAGADDLAGKGP